MPTHEQIIAYVEGRVTKQQVDGDGDTFWEVVDRFRNGKQILPGKFKTEAEANLHRDGIRAQRVQDIESGSVEVH